MLPLSTSCHCSAARVVGWLRAAEKPEVPIICALLSQSPRLPWKCWATRATLPAAPLFLSLTQLLSTGFWPLDGLKCTLSASVPAFLPAPNPLALCPPVPIWNVHGRKQQYQHEALGPQAHPPLLSALASGNPGSYRYVCWYSREGCRVYWVEGQRAVCCGF